MIPRRDSAPTVPTNNSSSNNSSIRSILTLLFQRVYGYVCAFAGKGSGYRESDSTAFGPPFWSLFVERSRVRLEAKPHQPQPPHAKRLFR